jgi:hypothetical protein
MFLAMFLCTFNSEVFRYSVNMLWMAMSWHKTSPALYRFLLQEGILCLPSVSYLKRIVSMVPLETGLSPSTIVYLQKRVERLDERSRTAALMIDEVGCIIKVQYL